MVLVDVNVLVHAFREDSTRHRQVHPWFERLVASEEPFALSELVLAGFLRVVTHPRVFTPPTPLGEALAFTEALRAQPHCLLVSAGPRHWPIFTRLCRESDARGNLISDAFLAALAMETGCEWVTTDRDFARFPGLRWTTPA